MRKTVANADMKKVEKALARKYKRSVRVLRDTAAALQGYITHEVTYSRYATAAEIPRLLHNIPHIPGSRVAVVSKILVYNEPVLANRVSNGVRFHGIDQETVDRCVLAAKLGRTYHFRSESPTWDEGGLP